MFILIGLYFLPFLNIYTFYEKANLTDFQHWELFFQITFSMQLKWKKKVRKKLKAWQNVYDCATKYSILAPYAIIYLIAKDSGISLM